MRLLQASSKDESKPDGGSDRGVKTWLFPDISTFCFTIMATYQAVGAMATVSLAPTEATLVNDVSAVAT